MSSHLALLQLQVRVVSAYLKVGWRRKQGGGGGGGGGPLHNISSKNNSPTAISRSISLNNLFV